MRQYLPLYFVFVFIVFTATCNNEKEIEPGSDSIEEMPSDTLGYIETLDEDLEQILDVHAIPEIIGEGFNWSEGPVWVAEHHFLLFSDVPSNTVYKWTDENGVELYLEPSGYTGAEERGGEMGSNGLIIDEDGALILSQHGDRRIARMEAPVDQPEPEFTSIADQFEGARFNSPNDVVQHSSRSYYFTDPPYGLAESATQEIEIHGVYRVDPDGSVTLLTDELSRPNGLAFSPDESQLYVANSDPNRAIWMVYDVTESGDIENGQIFYDATNLVREEPGLPDGLKVRSDGTIFATGPGGIWIFTPEAEPLGKIKTGEFISNLAFDENEDTIFMTADSYLLKLEL